MPVKYSAAIVAHFPIAVVLFIGVEIIEQQVVVLDAVLKMIDHFLLFVNFDPEAASVIENVLLVIHVGLARQAATPRDDQLALRLEGVLNGGSPARLLKRVSL